MPRSKKETVPHSCPTCQQMTTRPRFCSDQCGSIFRNRVDVWHAPLAVTLGYCHMGTEITPVPEATMQKAAALREYQRREREAEAARQRIAQRQRAEISQECTPGEMRNDFTSKVSRGYTITCNCGSQVLPGLNVCARCRGKEGSGDVGD